MVAIPAAIKVAVEGTVGWLWKEYGKTVAEKTVGRVVDEGKWQWGLTNYYYSLFERVGFVRILGRREAEPLENVFTHVNVLDRELAERRYDVARLRAEFAPRDFRWQERVERLPGSEAVAEYDKLFILGKPGAGKTTFLKHTALRAIEGEIDQVPVFVSLKELSDSGMGIVDFIVHQFEVHQVTVPAPFVEELLRAGKALVLLDGLDEVNVAGEKRSDLIQAINEFVYRYGECPMLLTCRVAAVDYSFTQFEYVEMADFDQEQMGHYIDRWFGGDEVKRKNCRRELLEMEENEPIRELAQVPLLLSLLCLVFEERNEFPRQRHEIYEEATRALLSKWDATRNIKRDTVYGTLSVRRKEQMLAHVAATTFEEGVYFLQERRVVDLIEGYLQGVPGRGEADGEPVDGEKVLAVMEAQHGMFVERARGIHSFSHLTLQEYFTAHYIVMNERRGTVELLMAHVGDERWDEVLLLVAGMLGDATEFVELYLDQLEEIVAEAEGVVALLDWVEETRQGLPAVYGVEGARAYLLSSARDLVLAHHRVLALAGDRDRALNLDRDRALVVARNRARALARALDLNLDRALALDHARALAPDLHRARALAPDLARARALVLVLDRALGLDRALDRALDRVTDVASRSGDAMFIEAVAALEAPGEDADLEVWSQYAEELVAVLEEYRDHWDPDRRLGLTEELLAEAPSVPDEQVEVLLKYLEANMLLVRCLEVAYVGDRDQVAGRILLPPGREPGSNQTDEA